MFNFIGEAERSPFVRERFEMSDTSWLYTHQPEFGYGVFGELVYYRSYSRLIGGKQERWPDTIVRVVNGVFSIRKDWYARRGITWDEYYWQDVATVMSRAMFHMRMLPPGRGLYAMGTEHVYKVGSMPLFNCGATTTRSAIYTEELCWLMDALMCGVGVGIEVTSEPIKLHRPYGTVAHQVVDSREGWVDSVRQLCLAYTQGLPLPVFDYSGIRAAGTPLRGIGGVASGPEPLVLLHERMILTFEQARAEEMSFLRMRADHANQIGACVTMGDVRRSAEMLIGPAGSDIFLSLKDYELYPYRAAWGWASNNTIAMDTPKDVEWALADVLSLPAHVERPGLLNRMLMQAGGDPATLVNPCGEIPLVSRELCNLAETFPMRCDNEAEYREALHLAALYTQTVSLLPTHHPSTNEVMVRHRRIGVSMTGVSSLFDSLSIRNFRAWCQGNREYVRREAEWFSKESLVAAPIACTTVKPSGTVSQLAGVTPGMHWGIDKYAVRRIRVGQHHPVRAVLQASGCEFEIDPDSGSHVFRFPIYTPGRIERDVPLHDQLALLGALQDEWAENSVSCTLKYHENDPDLHKLIRAAAEQMKLVSFMPHESQETRYALPPYQRITAEEYERMQKEQKPIRWDLYRGDGEDAQFCDAQSCDLRPLGKGSEEEMEALP